MKLPILASFLVFIAIVYGRIKASDKEHQKSIKEFWEKEQKANNTRKKSLDNLHYVAIPDNLLNMKNICDDEDFQSLIDVLNDLSKRQIVNLTGISNTDLKLTYGTANITPLTEYDNNYTLLVRTLQKMAEYLMNSKRISEAIEVLEFSVSTGSDVSKTYFLLASLYKEQNSPEKINSLIASANKIHSAMKPTIVHTLQESYQSCG